MVIETSSKTTQHLGQEQARRWFIWGVIRRKGSGDLGQRQKGRVGSQGHVCHQTDHSSKQQGLSKESYRVFFRILFLKDRRLNTLWALIQLIKCCPRGTESVKCLWVGAYHRIVEVSQGGVPQGKQVEGEQPTAQLRYYQAAQHNLVATATAELKDGQKRCEVEDYGCLLHRPSEHTCEVKNVSTSWPWDWASDCDDSMVTFDS